jgi:hypothetical protein
LKEAYTNIGRKIPKGVWRISRLSELPALIEKINGDLPIANYQLPFTSCQKESCI